MVKGGVEAEIATEPGPIEKKEIAMARKRNAVKGSRDLVREAY